MSQQALLKRVIEVLEGAQIPYMVTGSIASSIQGEPRSTHDIDIVVVMSEAGISALRSAFPGPEFYLDELSIREAMKRKDMFNLLHADTGDKVDFWMLTNEEFDQLRFSHRIEQAYGAMRLKVSRPEDTILIKLRWSEMSGGSAKQFHDALRVYEVQRPSIDEEYLNEWAGKLGVSELLTRLRHDAGTPGM